MILKARYVVPVDAPVIEDGAVVVENGCITAVGPAHKLQGRPGTDYGDAVICPGFVNAHTHLDLSLLAGRVSPAPDFTDWLWRLVTTLREEPPTRRRVREAVRTGVAHSLNAGVTMVGDVTTTPPWTREVLAGSAMSGVSFGEVIAIGRTRDALAERLDAAVLTFDLRLSTFDHLRAGIAPHSPYTVEPDAMRACAKRAAVSKTPLCIHLAETAEEELFTRACSGPFAAYLRRLNVWDAAVEASGCGPVELALRTGLLGKHTVIAHANYVGDDDIARIARSGASVAYCPRTHHAFSHPPHRFRDMAAAGINVCVGTDSLASNPSLSILDELRFLWDRLSSRSKHSELSPQDILSMGTLRGAVALGFARTHGSLTMGKAADLVVVPLDGPSRRLQPARTWHSILESAPGPIAVYISGVRQPHGAL